MTEVNDLFDYGYKIYQNSEYFKFSLDSILLAEFVKSKKGDSVLDMCTGNLPIPMILTQKDTTLKIDAIEIQKEIFELGKRSLELNDLHNINIINENVKNYPFTKKYDIITCNPPFFKLGEKSLVNQNETKRIARHEVTIKLDEIIELASNNLKENGKFYMVHRASRLFDVTNCLEKNKFGIRKICFVLTKQGKDASLFLIEAQKNKKTDSKIYCVNTENMKSYQNIFKEV